MTGDKRREKLIEILQESESVVSGEKLSKQLNVSRQVIVQDISILRAKKIEIFSTTRGYYLNQSIGYDRILKVKHNEDQIIEEMYIVVDLGGVIEDVFVYHKIYGILRAKMAIKSRKDVMDYVNSIKSGNSSPLMNLTAGYHYHTISADSEQTLKLIKDEIEKKGFLAELRDYEPVDFWDNKRGTVDD